MKRLFHRFFCYLLCLFAMTGLCAAAAAQEVQATDISKDVAISSDGFSNRAFLTDGDTFIYKNSRGDCSIYLRSYRPKRTFV